MTYCYKKESTMFYLCDGDDILDSMEEVAIGYSDDPEGAILLKHGSRDRIEKWMNKTVKAYKESGLDEWADQIKMVVSPDWDLEDLNRFINNTGYFGMFLKKQETKT